MDIQRKENEWVDWSGKYLEETRPITTVFQSPIKPEQTHFVANKYSPLLEYENWNDLITQFSLECVFITKKGKGDCEYF